MLICLFAISLAFADNADVVYSYVDSTGKTIYTNRLEDVPAKYRTTVKKPQLPQLQKDSSTSPEIPKAGKFLDAYSNTALVIVLLFSLYIVWDLLVCQLVSF